VTEAEWLECSDLKEMLDFLSEPANKRRLRLFAVAAARDTLEHNPDEVRAAYGEINGFAASLLRAEAYADGQGTLQWRSDHGVWWAEVPTALDAAYAVLGMDADIGAWTGDPAEIVPQAIKDFQVQPSHWLRCIFGNPFRPVDTSPAWWRDTTAVRIAQEIYEVRGFEQVPLLADALEEAGCDDAEVLLHCRAPGPHARGCWVVDACLGKS
jgi:hypothetical protein